MTDVPVISVDSADDVRLSGYRGVSDPALARDSGLLHRRRTPRGRTPPAVAGLRRRVGAGHAARLCRVADRSGSAGDEARRHRLPRAAGRDERRGGLSHPPRVPGPGEAPAVAGMGVAGGARAARSSCSNSWATPTTWAPRSGRPRRSGRTASCWGPAAPIRCTARPSARRWAPRSRCRSRRWTPRRGRGPVRCTRCASSGWHVVGLTPRADCPPLWDVVAARPRAAVALVFGHEGDGLSQRRRSPPARTWRASPWRRASIRSTSACRWAWRSTT